MKSNKKTFWMLMVAYAASMAYQYYRSTVNQFPAFDTFGVQEIAGYAVFFAWSSLALVEKRWAQWAVLVLCILQLLIGVLYYLPVIFVQRHDTFWDWAECIVFIYLIAWAGIRTWRQLATSKTRPALKTLVTQA
jgi:phosphatidylserine synthase